VNLLRNLRKLGFHFSAAESEGVMHLWRYAGYLVGIAPELLRTTETEGANLCNLVLDLSGAPDQHSVELTRVLMQDAMPAPMEASLSWLMRVTGLISSEGLHKRLGRFCFGLSHGLLGDELASELKYPPTRWRYTAPLLLRLLIRPLEACRRLLPGGTRLASKVGFYQIRRLMQNQAFARPVSFPGREAPNA
jgi:ER-bound oxygenase mpaB/B'/Rubber oxygenase, catalytic domain